MKLTTKQLKQIIKEEINILLEIGDSTPYNFKDGVWEKGDFVYYFTTDKEKGTLQYKVKFNLDTIAEPEAWEIDFNLIDKKQYDLTNQTDYKIMPTIVKIIKDFANNVEEHGEKEKIYFTFYGIKKDGDQDLGDSKRTRYYKWFLKRAGAEVTEDEDNNVTFAFDRNS
jgi:hypothetical protein